MVTQNIAPVTISFSNTSQGDNLTYLWSFGDGSTSAEANPTHTFQAGAWEVTLTVTNENGTDTSSAVIVATQPVVETGNQQQSNVNQAVINAAMTGGAEGAAEAFQQLNNQNNNQQNNNQQSNIQQNNNQQSNNQSNVTAPPGWSAGDGPPPGF
tara:strand:- start:372 stop:833 length:462 start_codon:yes stop_codon:yes gene_type:complete